MRTLWIGFGNLGRKLSEILSGEKERFPGLADLDISVVGLFTKSRGYQVDRNGIDLGDALRGVREEGRLQTRFSGDPSLPILTALRELDYDTLLELSTLSIEGRGEPALGYVRIALGRGKHVVTANKGPSAFGHGRLLEMAQAGRCLYRHESTVMDGAPIFNLARHGLQGCRVQAFSGILNSTTNYVLSCLEQGGALREAVRTAQRRGFAEADPQHDLQGWDAAAKVSVLANSLMGACITPFDVRRQGLSESTAAAAREALSRGARVKMVCSCRSTPEGTFEPQVEVLELPGQHPFAQVEGTGNILRLETDLMGPLMIQQEQPDLYDTAYGVLNDLMEAAAFGMER